MFKSTNKLLERKRDKRTWLIEPDESSWFCWCNEKNAADTTRLYIHRFENDIDECFISNVLEYIGCDIQEGQSLHF